jgi:hypothetical protein
VDSFRAADQLMGSAFRQKLSAYQRALELAGPEPERGFQSQFAADTGSGRTYISYINKIATDPDLFSALNKHQSVGFNTLLALTEIEPEIKAIALDQLDSTGRLVETDIDNIVADYLESHSSVELSEFEEAQIDREIELERLEREQRARERALETLVPSDRNIDQLVTLIISGGQQLDSYCLKTNSAVQPETFAAFVANRLVELSDRCGSDPEVYTSNLESVKTFIGLVARALDSVPCQRDSHLKLVK